MPIRLSIHLFLLGISISLSPALWAQPSPAFTPQQLRADPTDAWLTNGGNSFNQRYSPLDQINRSTVGKLKAEWQVHMNKSGSGPNHSGQAQPLFYDGMLYVSTGEDDVFAIDIETGKFKWVYQAKLDSDRVNVCCGWVNRGVAMGQGQIYLGQLDAKLVAIDQVTGKVNWQIQAEDPLLGFSLTAAPLYYNGMVIIGFAGGERAIRGRIKAYDAKTGNLLWTFYTIPGPGERGHDTWPANNAAWETGGAPIWHTPAVDAELGLLYFATGNAGPDLNGINRTGDNLFTASILALDEKTGQYKWHYQEVHHDIWDYDAPNPVILFDANVNGVPRKGLAQVGKSGFLYILDRVTGQPLTPIPEVEVPQEPRNATAKSQPWPSGDPVVPNEIEVAPKGYTLVNKGRTFTPFATQLVLYKPYSGVNWPPSAYDPSSHLMYICANDRVGAAQREEKNSAPRFDKNWLGGALTPPNVPINGLFVAMDLTTHKIAWSQQWNYSCSAGSLVTGGGLIIHGRNDGRVVALDKSDGTTLWEYQTDAGVNGSASTFMYKGTQYVAIISAGSAYATGPHGDSVWLFSLKGTKASAPLTNSQLNPALAAVNGVRTIEPVAGYKANLSSGRKIYASLCITCHGDSGEGGHQGGPPLKDKELSVSHIMTMASYGRNTMPGFQSAYTREQLQDVASYIIDELLKK